MTITSINAENLLRDGLQSLGVEADTAPFMQYLSLLEKWNKVHNLTAIRDFPSMITHHLLDSLAILPYIKGPRLIDIGSGAGFPGIPIALLNPLFTIVLLDSNGKKTRFLQEVKRVLQLKNIEIVQVRAEIYSPTSAFDTVMSRAFGSLGNMISWTQHLIEPSGQWLAMKGHVPTEELTALTHSYHVEMCRVPGLDEQRCCVIINNNKN